MKWLLIIGAGTYAYITVPNLPNETECLRLASEIYKAKSWRYPEPQDWMHIPRCVPYVDAK